MNDEHRTKIAFIIEGTKSEPLIINNLQKNFFNKAEIKPIILPACTNIYALWKKIHEDDGDTDIIELIKEVSENQKTKRIDNINDIDFRELNREDYSEIYLFFDYDGHNDNLPATCNHNDVMKKMLETFDNETENGKMYISYPMVESIKHFNRFEICNDEISCFTRIDMGKDYKAFVAGFTIRDNLTKYSNDDWRYVLLKYISSIYCLFDLKSGLTRDEYLKKIIPKNIFEKQFDKYIKVLGGVMVLSAFPEFLLDYFKLEVLENMVGYNGLLNVQYNHSCIKWRLENFAFNDKILLKV